MSFFEPEERAVKEVSRKEEGERRWISVLAMLILVHRVWC